MRFTIHLCRQTAFSLVMFSLSAVVAAEPAVRFETDIRPIFREFCFDCHGATEKLEGGLDLRLVRFLTQGGESGPAIVPGDADSSYLIERVANGEMPPDAGHVPREKLDLLRRWIADGAPTTRDEPEHLDPGIPITLEERSYWAYQPIQRPAVPEYGPDERVRTPIDALLREAMPAGVSFSPDADRETLIKRLYFDLVGLPPTAEELEGWKAAEDDNWYSALIDELLDSPHYGERWARHWLDVAGYADSEGFTLSDAERPWAWKYRDYVIRSLNADKPFDRFITEQLAGDELAGPANRDWSPEQIELLTATGFLRMAADGTGSGDNSPEARNKVVADTLQIVGSSLLGVSLNCAQCHDHRYDPISQVDYYAIRSVFEPALDWNEWKSPDSRRISLYTAADREQAAEIEKQAEAVSAERAAKQREYMQQALEKELQKYEEPLREQLRLAYQTADNERTDQQKALLKQHPSVNISPGVLYQYLPDAAEDLKKYDARIQEIHAKKPPEEFLRALQEPPGHGPVAHLFHRGDHQQLLQEVAPAGLTVFAPEGERAHFAVNDESRPTTGRRLAFAQWLRSDDNPALARVIVNRIWMHHFGRGIVPTPSEFGKLGSRPTHPELLDWLAAEFRDSGWSLKSLHRAILSSTAWRQSSFRDPAKDAVDPENRFYWRKSLQRLDAEVLRDRMLVASGTLNRDLFGPPAAIKEDDAGQVIVDGEQTRRSLYIRVRRTQTVAMLQSFEAPVMKINCELRPVSTVATQSLMLLNGEFTIEQAGRVAERALREAPPLNEDQLARQPSLTEGPKPVCSSGQFHGPLPDPRQLPGQINHAWQLILARRPSPEELDLAVSFAGRQLRTLHESGANIPSGSSPTRQVLVNLCQMLLNSNEFLYVD